MCYINEKQFYVQNYLSLFHSVLNKQGPSLDKTMLQAVTYSFPFIY